MTTNNTNIIQFSVPTTCLSLMAGINKVPVISFCGVQKFTQSYTNCANFNTVQNSLEYGYKDVYNYRNIQKKLNLDITRNFKTINNIFLLH